jgi:hypothetical protein
MEDEPIEFQKVKEDDFKKGLLSGEILPHDVEITIKYRDGTTRTGAVPWETIVALFQAHNINAVGQTYEMMVDNFL